MRIQSSRWSLRASGSPPEIEDVADGRRAADVVERHLQPGFGRGDRPVAHHPRAGAVAAVARAEVGHQQQHAVGIAVDQARHGAIAVFAQRIVGFAEAAVELGGRGDHGSPQGLALIVARDQAHVVGRDADRQHRALREGRPLFFRQHQHLFQLGQGSQAISGLPVPIVPIAIGNRGVESLAESPGLEGAAGSPARRGAGGEDISLGGSRRPFRP